MIREPERQADRGRISCPDPACGAGLNWRKRSKDGKAPTFYGNHLDGCQCKAESEEQIAERELEEVDAVINTCDEMKIRLDTPSRQRSKTKDEPDSADRSTSTSLPPPTSSGESMPASVALVIVG